MEESKPSNEEDDRFFDASDEFPFYDCSGIDQSQLSTSDSTSSGLHELPDPLTPQPSELSSTATLRRRRSLFKHNRHRVSGGDLDPGDSTVSSGTSQVHEETTSRERRFKIHRKLKENEGEIEKCDSTQDRVVSVPVSKIVSEQNDENSIITSANIDGVNDELVEEIDESSSNFLVHLSGLVIKAIGFQIKLLITLCTFPIWSFYCCCMFFIDPFRTIRHGREYLMHNVLRIWGIICDSVSPFIVEWLKEQKLIGKLVLKFGWGFLWATYVGFVLCVLLVSSFVTSGLVMRYVVEEPIQMKETLNFDYTKNSPVAFVPVIACPEVGCYDVHCREKIEVGKGMGMGLRVIPPNHKLQVTVLLTLPESDYNRNLGMFQVRADFLSANGKVLSSLRHPCMLQFSSQPIRLMLTFLKVAPLVTGYSSESQTLSVRMRGFTEGNVPTSCLKLVIEQRAEFRHGAGIPEIYSASLILESELPLFKKLMWYWKKTLFIWTSMMLFLMELFFAVLCCRPIILPRLRTRGGPAGSNTPQNSQPQHN